MELNKVITLANKEKYLVLNKATGEDNVYYYVAELNDNLTDIKDNYKIVMINEENNIQYMEEVLGENKLKSILPLFIGL